MKNIFEKSMIKILGKNWVGGLLLFATLLLLLSIVMLLDFFGIINLTI
jgi:hypothetical protein